MKTTKILIFCVLTAILTQSCYKRNGWGINGKGETVSERRSAEGFDRISLCIDGDLTYKQDAEFFIEISAQSNILAVIRSEVRSNELKFDYKREVWKHKPIRIIVHSPSLAGVSVSGSGNVTCTGTVTAKNLSMQVSGSGNVSFNQLVATNVTARISGSGIYACRGAIV
jgi:hypothetical protein